MTNPPTHDVTQLLAAWQAGDESALERLMPLVYETLQEIASRYLRREDAGHTLQTTALVHEAYLRLVGADRAWEGRRHFFAVAATTMRRILVDHARARHRIKRGGEMQRVELDTIAAPGDTDPVDILALDAALTALSREDPRKAQAVELHYFGGLDYPETAAALGVGEATVHRDLRFARAWLRRALEDGER
jgi:RNA polymerase sigma-70 factor (ECF subfamily)